MGGVRISTALEVPFELIIPLLPTWLLFKIGTR
jgi:hypothetical protein